MYRKKTQDKLLRKVEVGNRLALSVRSVDRLVSAGKLQKVRVLSVIRFKESDVQNLINESCK